MKFTKLIHPEIALDKRGPEESRQVYRKVLSKTGMKLTDKGFDVPAHILGYMTDTNITKHFGLSLYYKQNNGKAYYIPKDFLSALSKIDREIPVKYLPERFIGYFQFAEDVLKDDTDIIDGGYIYIGPAFEMGMVDIKDQKEKIMVASYFSKEYIFGFPKSICSFSVRLTQQTVDQMAEQVPNTDNLYFDNQVELKKRNLIFRTLLNAALYVHSADPEIMKLRPSCELTHTQRSFYRKKQPLENNCTIPINVLNWAYHTGKTYQVDSTMVQTHMRWQPCGPGLSQVKLLWVREHERHFKGHVE